jgi:NADH-quinone oxidoreductase subunit C
MGISLEQLGEKISAALGDKVTATALKLDELTLTVKAQDFIASATTLRDHADLRFSLLIDLCGVDYSAYGDGAWDGARYCVVYHLLSLEHNFRVRVKIFAIDEDFPVVDSVTDVWPGANWYEREAFDLYGIVFQGHNDLRRLLTDYGFVGHPFRKDFPITGNVEMRYDPEQKRVVYQPVTIEPREIVPRVIREEHYGEAKK